MSSSRSVINNNNKKFKWLGEECECYNESLKRANAAFYRSFMLNKIQYDVGNFAMVSVNGKGRVCRLLCVYESKELWHNGRVNRGIVRWYTWAKKLEPECNPTKIILDPLSEIIEDLRDIDTFINLETIQRKCAIMFGTEDDAHDMITRTGLDTRLYFYCRFRIQDKTIEPVMTEDNILKENFDEFLTVEIKETENLEAVTPKRTSKNLKRKSVLQNVNLNFEEQGISPSKSPKLILHEKETKNYTPDAVKVKRNLHQSFQEEAEIEELNYSIVETDEQISNELKLKLRLSKKPVVQLNKLTKQDINNYLQQKNVDLEKTSNEIIDLEASNNEIIDVEEYNDEIIDVEEYDDKDFKEVKIVCKEDEEMQLRRSVRSSARRKSYVDYFDDIISAVVSPEKIPGRRGRSEQTRTSSRVTRTVKKEAPKTPQSTTKRGGRKTVLNESPPKMMKREEVPKTPSRRTRNNSVEIIEIEIEPKTPSTRSRRSRQNSFQEEPQTSSQTTREVEFESKTPSTRLRRNRQSSIEEELQTSSSQTTREVEIGQKTPSTRSRRSRQNSFEEEPQTSSSQTTREVEFESKTPSTRSRRSRQNSFEEESQTSSSSQTRDVEIEPKTPSTRSRRSRQSSIEEELQTSSSQTTREVEIGQKTPSTRSRRSRQNSFEEEPQTSSQTTREVEIEPKTPSTRLRRSRQNSFEEEPETSSLQTTREVEFESKTPSTKLRRNRQNSIEEDSQIPQTPSQTTITRGRKPKNKFIDELKPMTPRKSILKSNQDFGTPKKSVCYDEAVDVIHFVDTPSKMKNGQTPTKKSTQSKPVTPSARAKMIREGLIKPSMQTREMPVEKAATPLAKARTKLHVSYIPDILPCREKEFSDIYHFLEGKLLDGCGGCMYISGVPGTGKTATVTEVIRQLQNRASEFSLPQFDYVMINGMRLTEPRQSYVEILRQLTGGKTVPWEQAQSILESKFATGRKQGKNKSLPVVLIVDELDMLCTKRQDVVYNLLDWPTKTKTQLVVVTIANTMDLPERLLMSRVTSRLGLTRLTFQAYTHKQLQEIVTQRLTGTGAFNVDAVQYVARKVASVSGDARRALDICRRAAEVAEKEGGPQTLVSMEHVNTALNDMMTQPKIMAIKHCTRLEKIILQAVVAEMDRTGIEETCFLDVYKIMESLCALEGLRMVTMSLVLAAVSRLGAYRLLITDQKLHEMEQKLILNVSPDDVHFALRKD